MRLKIREESSGLRDLNPRPHELETFRVSEPASNTQALSTAFTAQLSLATEVQFWLSKAEILAKNEENVEWRKEELGIMVGWLGPSCAVSEVKGHWESQQRCRFQWNSIYCCFFEKKLEKKKNELDFWLQLSKGVLCDASAITDLKES